jgi:MFS family permease
LTTGFQLSRRNFLAIIILFSSLFTWYFSYPLSVLRHITGSSVESYEIAYATFNFIIVITLLLSNFFIHKFNKLDVIYSCSVATFTVSLLVLITSSMFLKLIVIFVTGILFSVCQLAFFVFFWSITKSEERGRVSGFTAFVALLSAYTISGIMEVSNFNVTVILGAALSLMPLSIILLKPKMDKLKVVSGERGNYPERRTILLYSIPWVLFSLVNSTLSKNISFSISQQTMSVYVFLIVLQLFGALIGTLSGGIIADFFGRRISLAFSLTLYGISSALSGVVNNYVLFCIIYAANGLSWGILLNLYSFVIWGDMSNKENSAKMYTIGLVIYYLTMGIGFLPTQISQISLAVSALASCFLIFLSNIPVVVAPELLSSDFREKIKLKLHMKAVKKVTHSRNHG